LRAAANLVSLPRMAVINDNFGLGDRVVLITGRRAACRRRDCAHAACGGANVLIHYRSSAAAAIALADEFNTLRAHSAAVFAAHL